MKKVLLIFLLILSYSCKTDTVDQYYLELTYNNGRVESVSLEIDEFIDDKIIIARDTLYLNKGSISGTCVGLHITQHYVEFEGEYSGEIYRKNFEAYGKFTSERLSHGGTFADSGNFEIFHDYIK